MPPFLKTNVWSFFLNLSSGTRSTFKLALRFCFGGELGFCCFVNLFASGPCRPKILSSPFPPQQKTGSFATKISDFPGGNGYPQVHQLGQNIPSMSPTNWKHDSRGMAGTKNIHVSTGSSACDLNFFVLYW